MTFDRPSQARRGRLSERRGHRYFGGNLTTNRHQQRHFGGEYAAAIAIAGLAVAAIGTGVSAYASYEQGQAQAKAHRYNRQVAENQRSLALQQAGIEADTAAERNRRFQATQRALEGISCVTEEGSPLLVLADTARQMERDQYLIRYGGKTAATGFEAQAGLSSLYGRQAQRAGQIGAGVSLLSGAGNAASQYGTYRYRTGA